MTIMKNTHKILSKGRPNLSPIRDGKKTKMLITDMKIWSMRKIKLK